MFSFFGGKKRKSTSTESLAPAGLEFFRLSELAVTPTKRHSEDAGFDLYSVVNFKLKKGSRHLFNTNIRVVLPEGHAGIILGRSGLAVHNGIVAHQGVVDRGYTGDISVLLFNFGEEDYEIHKGDRIAQILIVRLYDQQVTILTGREDTETRGESGFGSSGA